MNLPRRRLDAARPALSGHPRLLLTSIVTLALVLFFTAGTIAWFSYEITGGLPNRDAIRRIGDMARSTTIFDAADTPVFTIFKEQRYEVPLKAVSPHLVKAVLAIEDQRFYEHSGVDGVRVVAALRRNLREGRRAEGGSTITQQLARQSFLSRDKTYRRKITEVILASYLESSYTKDDILELYLNKVYFGDGLYGVEAAARGYFGKPAAALDVAESALLAGLIQSPSGYAPTVNLEKAIARRDVVLEAMASSGAIDRSRAERAKRARVRLVDGLEKDEPYGSYFKEQVRLELVDRFGWDRVYRGGLRVYTTLDSDLQQAAETHVENGLRRIEKRRAFRHAPRTGGRVESLEATPYLQGALVAIDPSTGYVRALVGGRDFQESRFNRAVQARRQAGSAFKPFVFAAALEKGYSPGTVLTGLNNPVWTVEGDWVPEDGHSTASSMTLRTALKTSSNRAAVQLLTSVGIPSAVAYARKLQVGTPPSVPSLALGAGDVTLLSLTSAYGAFAAGGVIHPPVFLRRVEDSDGNVLYDDEKKAQRAVSEATAFLMASMLADVIDHGTGYRARQAGFTLPAAGKTGTTNDYVDAWFVGFTPSVVTGVWVGFDQPRPIVDNGYAGELAVPIWTDVMKAATKGHDPAWIARPGDVVPVNICRVSGKRPGAGCGSVQSVSRDGFLETRSAVYSELFVKGTEPSTRCTLHAAPSPFEGFTVPVAQAELPLPEVGDILAPQAAPRIPNPRAPPSPQPSAGVEARAPAAAPKAEADTPRKRGFWSRLFRRGGGPDNPPETKKAQPEVRKPPRQ
jgi:penicillin-binding protein 1A